MDDKLYARIAPVLIPVMHELYLRKASLDEQAEAYGRVAAEFNVSLDDVMDVYHEAANLPRAEFGKFLLGMKVETQVVKGRDGRWWWFVIPDGMDRETAYRETAIHPEKLYGPFPDENEVHEDMRLTIFGEQCEVKDGGMSDPNWDKPH